MYILPAKRYIQTAITKNTWHQTAPHIIKSSYSEEKRLSLNAHTMLKDYGLPQQLFMALLR